jgi:hypothetical protein
MGLVLVGNDTIASPALTNVPAMLRRMADDIESGKSPAPHSVLLVATHDDRETGLYLWGEYLNAYEVIGVLDLVKKRFMDAGNG